MASLKHLKLMNAINIKPISCSLQLLRRYSVYNPTYVRPVFRKEQQQALEESGELKVIKHLPIKPAFTNESSSEFYDPVVNKFINYLNREGNKVRARLILEKTFEKIKRLQIEKYHKAKTPEEQSQIELDPKIVLHKAIENSTPVLGITKVKKGAQIYQVPVPLTEKRSKFLGMNWLIQASNEKEDTERIWKRMAVELIDASENKGRVIRKKQELYRQCEANRSYAHFRWF